MSRRPSPTVSGRDPLAVSTVTSAPLRIVVTLRCRPLGRSVRLLDRAATKRQAPGRAAVVALHRRAHAGFISQASLSSAMPLSMTMGWNSAPTTSIVDRGGEEGAGSCTAQHYSTEGSEPVWR